MSSTHLGTPSERTTPMAVRCGWSQCRIDFLVLGLVTEVVKGHGSELLGVQISEMVEV
jgi:hypothetical protein